MGPLALKYGSYVGRNGEGPPQLYSGGGGGGGGRRGDCPIKGGGPGYGRIPGGEKINS